jgi:hypothetical protein
VEERKIHFAGPVWSLKISRPASKLNSGFEIFRPQEFSLRGKNRCCSTDFFQSRNFCAAFKNKVQIFACRFFAAFLISRRWQGARESSGVNKV